MTKKSAPATDPHDPSAQARPKTADLLLQSVGTLIRERNSLTFSLNEVAAHAGVNAALVKYYFGNKSGMLVALLERNLSPHLRAMEHLLSLDLPVAKKIRIHLDGMVRAYFKFPYLNRLLNHLLREPEADSADIHARFVEPVVDGYRRLIADGVAEGAMRPVDPVLFYVSTVGVCDQLVASRESLRIILGPDAVDEALCRRYAEHITGVILHGVMQPGR